MIFNIPCGKMNSYLDTQNSYLKFCVQSNDTTNLFNLDRSGYCFINQLTIFNSGNLIEQIGNYNVLMNSLNRLPIQSIIESWIFSNYWYISRYLWKRYKWWWNRNRNCNMASNCWINYWTSKRIIKFMQTRQLREKKWWSINNVFTNYLKFIYIIR